MKATGSSATVPPIEGAGLRGSFVMREADDALAIRAYAQEQGCKEAIVAGGGLLGLAPETRTLLVAGGSQGARFLNAAAAGAAGLLAREGIQAVHLAGERDADGVTVDVVGLERRRARVLIHDDRAAVIKKRAAERGGVVILTSAGDAEIGALRLPAALRELGA